MKSLYTVLAVLLFSLNGWAQSPQAINYQAVARDGSGALLSNQLINVRFTIHEGSATGTTVYQETHSASTNDYGLFSLKIGEGTVSSGSFASIAWGSHAYYLQVEIDKGSGYTDMGTQQLVSVPYALYANEAGNVINYAGGTGISISGNTITNTAPDQTVTLTGAGATTVTGTYPNFTISSTDNNTTYSAGTGISISGTTITNTAPDQTVTLTGAGATTVTGTYPNFTISSTDNNTTYTAGTGLTLSGTTFSAQNTSALWNANKLQGRAVAGTAPTTGQVLKWNGTAWTPGTDNSSPWTTATNGIYYNGGHVGIGTTNPQAALDVDAGSASVLGRFNSTAASSYLEFYTNAIRKGILWNLNGTMVLRSDAGPVAIQTNGNNYRLFITGSGNTGILTNAPTGELDVRESYNGDRVILANAHDVTIGDMDIGAWGTYLKVDAENKGNFQFINGNVGIGTTNPVQRLDVTSGSPYSYAAFHNSISGSTSTDGFLVGLGGLSGGGYVWNYEPGGLYFGASGSTDMFIDTSGFVGIGTISPKTNLHIYEGSSGLFGSYTSLLLNNVGNGSTGSDGLEIWSASGFMADAAIWNYENTPLRFGTNSVERMRITGSGEIGINTISPATILHVNHPTGTTHGFSLSNDLDSDRWHFYVWSTNSLGLYFNGSQVGSFNPTTGAYTALSDRRFKTNIEPMGSALDKIKALQPVQYRFIDQPDDLTHIGFIAQDVEPVFPSLVNHIKPNPEANENEDLYTLDYAGFSVVAIKAIQEQQEIIEELNGKITKLQQQVDELQSMLNK